MAIEKRLAAVSPQSFTSDGTSDGLVTVTDASLFKVKQKVIINANTLPNISTIEVKRVVDATQLYVGPVSSSVPGSGSIDSRTNISAYTVALGANIFADEQPRPAIPNESIVRANYEEEPTVAERSVLVDKLGNKIDNVVDSHGINRLAVDGQFHAEVDVQVDVDIDGYYDPVTNPDPDNIGLIGHTRSNPTDQTDQTQRITAIRGSLDTTTVSQDVSLHDQDGNAYTPINPLPVSTSYEKFFALINGSPWLKLGNYEEVTPTVIGNDLLLSYIEVGGVIGEALITNYISETGWNLTLSAFINDDDGSKLQDDNGTFLNLD